MRLSVLVATAITLLVAWFVGSSILAQGSVTISGQVLDQDGNPRPGSVLELCEEPPTGCWRAETEADGRFEFNAPTGTYVIATYAPQSPRRLYYLEGGDGNLSWESDDVTWIEVGSIDISGIEITLPSPTQVSGRVRRSNGNPEAAVNILLCPFELGSCRAEITDNDGRFSFVVPRDDYWILINVPNGLAQGVYHPGAPGGFSEDQGNKGLIAVRAEPVIGIEITLPARLDDFPHSVSGTVRLVDGRAADGWSVQVCGQECKRGQSLDNVMFSAPAAPGPTYINIHNGQEIVGRYHVGSPGNFSQVLDLFTTFMVPSDEATGIEILLPQILFPAMSTPSDDAGGSKNRASETVTVAGRITRWDDLPEVGLAVSVCGSLDLSCLVFTLTDDDGRFELSELPSDRYFLQFRGSHRGGYYATGVPGNYVEDDEQATKIDLTQGSVTGLEVTRFKSDDDRPYVVSGTLLFADGTPAHDWSVRACKPECAIGHKLVDGRFAIQVAAGDHELQVWRDNNPVGATVVGGYQQGLPGNYAEHPGQYTLVTAPGDIARNIEIRVPSHTQLEIEMQPGPGATFTTQHVVICPWPRDAECELLLGPRDRFSRLLTPGAYQIRIEFASGAFGYYSAEAPGNFTWAQAEQSSFTVPDAEPTTLTIVVPAQDKLRINIIQPNGELDHHPDLWVAVCPDERQTDCVSVQNATRPDGRKGQFNLQRPAGPHFIRVQRAGYALGDGAFGWYVNESAPGGLVEKRADATIFAANHVHPATRVITLPDIPQTIPVQIELQPGVSLVGGPAGAVRVADLFAQAEQLIGVILLSDEDEPQQVIARSQAETKGQDAYLSAGRIAWMYVSGHEPIALRWNARRGSFAGGAHTVHDPPGPFIWQSREPGTVADVARGLTHVTQPPGLVVVENGAVALKTTGTVGQGDVIWVQSAIPFRPQPRTDIRPHFSYPGRDDPDFRDETERKFLNVIEFFWREFGLEADALDVEIFADTATPEYLLARCGWARHDIKIACIDEKTMAREYARTLQFRISRELDSPGWLVEGAVEYAAGLFLRHADAKAGDPIAEHRPLRDQAASADTTLRSLESAAQDWKPVDHQMRTTLSALAVDWLVAHTGGYDAVWTYFRYGFANLIDDSKTIHDWHAGFEAAFGLSVEEFYERFAEYRANGFQLVGG